MSETEQQPLSETEREEWEELLHTAHEDLSDEQVTSKIKLSMKRKYSAPEWVLCFELADPNGRRADAIAINTFPSRNFKILGFEFKASRSDWLAEKRDGAKADYFVQVVDEWYVVAGRRGIVEEKELPEGWGLLELKDNRDDQLWKLVESELTEHQRGGPDRAFWGRLLQKTVGGTSNFTTADLEEARSRGFEDALERAKKRADRDVERLERKAESYDRLAEEFDFISRYGRMNETDIRRLNLAFSLVRTLEGGRRGAFTSKIESLRRQTDRTVQRVEESVEEFHSEAMDLVALVDGEDDSR